MFAAFDKDKPEEFLRRSRLILFIIGVIYPFYSKAHLASFPNDADPIEYRLAVTFVLLSFFCLTYFNSYFRRHSVALVHVGLYFLTLHLFFLLHMNTSNVFILWGLTALLFMITPFLFTRFSQIVFGALVAASSCVVAVFATSAQNTPWEMFILINITIVIFMNFEGHMRHRC